MLMPVSPRDAVTYIEAFQQGLRELGYIEGQHAATVLRYSDGRDARLPDLAAELVRLNVSVMVTWGTPAARAAKNATTTIPIVTAAVVDPVGTGLIASLARPGGNLTGVTTGGAELSRKSLELLREVVPEVTRIAVIGNPANPVIPIMIRETRVAAQALDVQIQTVEASDRDTLDRAFATMSRERPGGLLVLQDPVLHAHRQRIVDFAAKNRLPAMYERKPWVEAGGLMSYGVSFPGSFHRAAYFVDRILKGAKPADLPAEQPTTFEFVINLRTAKALGLTISPSLLLRADQVIE